MAMYTKMARATTKDEFQMVDPVSGGDSSPSSYIDETRLSDDDDDLIANNLSRATLSLSHQCSLDETVNNNNSGTAKEPEVVVAEDVVRNLNVLRSPSQTNSETNEFLATRNGSLEIAAQLCKSVLLKALDGNLLKFWLLTEISSWDVERERLVYLTEKSVIVMKFDFIGMKLIEYKRYQLNSFDRVAIGELKYPHGSLIPSRNQIGVRCMWNKQAEISFIDKWNPLSKGIPWITVTSHPLLYSDVTSKEGYDVDDFAKSLLNVLNSLQSCQVIEAPIIIENYAGLVSAFANVSSLGFFKSRGKFSF